MSLIIGDLNMAIINKIKQLICKHEFKDKCKIDYYIKENGKDLRYQEICYSRKRNNHCKRHDIDGNLLGGYCVYFFQECSKCGKIKG